MRRDGCLQEFCRPMYHVLSGVEQSDPFVHVTDVVRQKQRYMNAWLYHDLFTSRDRLATRCFTISNPEILHLHRDYHCLLQAH